MWTDIRHRKVGREMVFTGSQNTSFISLTPIRMRIMYTDLSQNLFLRTYAPNLHEYIQEDRVLSGQLTDHLLGLTDRSYFETITAPGISDVKCL